MMSYPLPKLKELERENQTSNAQDTHGLGLRKPGRPKKNQEKELRCAYCPTKTKNKKQLLEHMNAIHDKNCFKKLSFL